MAFLDYEGLKLFTQQIKEYMSENFPSIKVDSSLSTTSTNAVQNKVITTELNKKANDNQTFTVSKERENLSLQRNMLPIRFQEYMVEFAKK